MNPPNGKITYGREIISFDVLSVKRKTLEIAVHPNCNVVIKVPIGTEFEEVKERVLRRARWIKRQIHYFRQFNPKTPARQYVAGETHLYLGRQYKLKITTGNQNEVRLTQGHFLIKVKGNTSPNKVRSLLEHWYAEKAAIRFNDSIDRYWQNFKTLSLEKPQLQIRRMHKRWGSLSKSGLLILNADLIRAPRECIDYVIVHELCHLKYHDHRPNFYRLLEEVMPDWKLRKHRLELALT